MILELYVKKSNKREFLFLGERYEFIDVFSRKLKDFRFWWLLLMFLGIICLVFLIIVIVLVM